MASERKLELRLAIVQAEISLEHAKRARSLVDLQRERVALRRQHLRIRIEEGRQKEAGGEQDQEETSSFDEGMDQHPPPDEETDSSSSSIDSDVSNYDGEGDENNVADDRNGVEQAPSALTDVPFQVNVKTLSGHTVRITATGHWDIARLKKAIEMEHGAPPDQQRLIFHGRQLEENQSLKYYGIQQESCLHMILRLRGC